MQTPGQVSRYPLQSGNPGAHLTLHTDGLSSFRLTGYGAYFLAYIIQGGYDMFQLWKYPRFIIFSLVLLIVFAGAYFSTTHAAYARISTPAATNGLAQTPYM